MSILLKRRVVKLAPPCRYAGSGFSSVSTPYARAEVVRRTLPRSAALRAHGNDIAKAVLYGELEIRPLGIEIDPA